jgi:hypothetical protein
MRFFLIEIYLFKNERKCPHFEIKKKENPEVKYNVYMLDSSLTKINMLTNEHLMHQKTMTSWSTFD